MTQGSRWESATAGPYEPEPRPRRRTRRPPTQWHWQLEPGPAPSPGRRRAGQPQCSVRGTGSCRGQCSFGDILLRPQRPPRFRRAAHWQASALAGLGAGRGPRAGPGPSGPTSSTASEPRPAVGAGGRWGPEGSAALASRPRQLMPT